MPNHVHGVLVISETDTMSLEEIQTQGSHSGFWGTEQKAPPNGAPAASLGSIVASYKAAVTRTANRTMRHGPRPLWQTRYHDHIIRNEDEWNRIRAYVIANPALWHEDTFYENG